MLKNKTIGIIGAGNIVFAAHLPLLKAMKSEPKWILDVSQKNAKVASKAFGIPTVLTPADLEKTEPTDFVLLACPYGVRKPYYDFLQKSSAALYIEKPVAKSVREHEEICSLREDYAISAGFLRRSMGITNIVKDLIEDEIFGKLRHIRSNFGTATQISSGGGFAKNIALAGGGQLFESAIHNIDAICYMTNSSRGKVVKKNMIHENGFDLHTEAAIELHGGQGHVIEFDLLVTCFQSVGYDIVMQFDSAILTFSLFDYTIPEIKARNGKRVYRVIDSLTEDYPRQQYDVMFTFWKDFLTACETRTPNYTNLVSTLVTTQIIEQLYEQAAGSRQQINL